MGGKNGKWWGKKWQVVGAKKGKWWGQKGQVVGEKNGKWWWRLDLSFFLFVQRLALVVFFRTMIPSCQQKKRRVDFPEPDGYPEAR